MRHLEIISVDYDGIEIPLRVDYDKGEISLVERANMDGWKAKQWLFAGRGLDYVNSWSKIMDAMKEAVRVGKMMLEHDLAEKAAFQENEIQKSVEAMHHAARIVNKKKK